MKSKHAALIGLRDSRMKFDEVALLPPRARGDSPSVGGMPSNPTP
jgi:hypothetical protein